MKPSKKRSRFDWHGYNLFLQPVDIFLLTVMEICHNVFSSFMQLIPIWERYLFQFPLTGLNRDLIGRFLEKTLPVICIRSANGKLAGVV